MLQISSTSKFGYKKAVKLKGRSVKVLDGLEKKLVEPGDSEKPSLSDEFWIEIEVMVDYINGLRSK